jgi:NitT/TauT family transport system substrate-binding protein
MPAADFGRKNKPDPKERSMASKNHSHLTRRSFLVKSAAGAATLFAAPYLTLYAWAAQKNAPLRIAVEFNSHAVPAYVAIEKKLYAAEGLNFAAYESYATGASLAAALTKGDIDAAYICLIPALNAYANAGVPIKVVCGTHLYGYGLAVNPQKILSIRDLEKQAIHVGGLREGTSADTVMHKAMERFDLDKQKILSKIRRMNPAKALFAVRAGQLDAVFLPEHWLTMTERYGFAVMLTARDLWPDMIGSVLVAKDALIRDNPEVVNQLVRATKKATAWMRQHDDESAELTSRYLSFESRKAPLAEVLENPNELKVPRESIARSMKNLDYLNSIDIKGVQETIDYTARIGNIRHSFLADTMLDLQFLQQA